MSDKTGEDSGTRAGFVALVGRPNVGKSTLLNTLLGEKLSIVTARAQTTRERVTGILTDEGVQIVFVDTPGLLEPRYLLQASMLDAALGALEDSDVVLLILDATQPSETFPTGDVLTRLRRYGDSLLVAINKTDAAAPADVDRLEARVREELDVEPHRISAKSGSGVQELREALIEALPFSPFFFPEDEIAVQSVRFFVSELIRETVFEEYHEEVPYSTAVRIEEFRESETPVFIRAVVYVERESQKAIVVGRAGTGIRRLGHRARRKIEEFLGTRVYLDLWVKTMPRWRKKPGALQHLGYPVPAESHRGSGRDGGAGKASRRRRSGSAEGRRPDSPAGETDRADT